MNVLDLMRQRRSVRHFDPTHQLSENELRTLITAGALAPSAYNMQNRHFVVVVDTQVKARLAEAAFGQAQVRNASAVFVLTGSRNAYKNTDRYLRDAPQPVREIFEAAIPRSYASNDALARDEDCRSVGLAGMNIMLMATELGYESGPLIGFDPRGTSEILGLPDDHAPLLLVVIGKGTQPPGKRLGLLDFEELASVDRFGQHTIVGAVQA